MTSTVKEDDAFVGGFLYKRLRDAYIEHERLIIAYDLDDTVRPYKSECCDHTKNLIRKAKTILNPYFIVFSIFILTVESSSLGIGFYIKNIFLTKDISYRQIF